MYSRVSNKHTGTFINFWIFFPPVCSYLDQYVYSFLAIHNFRPISAISDICNAYENQIFDSFIVDLDKKKGYPPNINEVNLVHADSNPLNRGKKLRNKWPFPKNDF